MAEFTEVMRQVHRMCEFYELVGCKEECKLQSDSGCVMSRIPCMGGCDNIKEIERIVMQWAAEHPEPKYPTWEEWQKKSFPTAQDVMHPCAFMNRKEVEKARGVECGRTPCNTCARSPIPADIAEKLGIKLIGGKDE